MISKAELNDAFPFRGGTKYHLDFFPELPDQTQAALLAAFQTLGSMTASGFWNCGQILRTDGELYRQSFSEELTPIAVGILTTLNHFSQESAPRALSVLNRKLTEGVGLLSGESPEHRIRRKAWEGIDFLLAWSFPAHYRRVMAMHQSKRSGLTHRGHDLALANSLEVSRRSLLWAINVGQESLQGLNNVYVQMLGLYRVGAVAILSGTTIERLRDAKVQGHAAVIAEFPVLRPTRSRGKFYGPFPEGKYHACIPLDNVGTPVHYLNYHRAEACLTGSGNLESNI